ncbi:MarR family winged helix-turn-helix transcriptional regulator [Pseudoclavibacter sp. CFCC 13611]|uniref:MarR family winged helix-turn-helix transcriptional regulator n=1 Tax=Pseudoclavibacter sp. CFCC 13611 TaxID=2615178 RepID=UPI001300FDC3|nr:MarR family transcriptional regulator [Pseudoclavibacter sp. CFCC 13611]KAB1664077.1 MarR family transcriptional regulator [Pseudoclavibacter sp. CFCC 13611]
MTEPRWLSPIELNAWMRFEAVVELMPGALDSQLQRDAQLTHFDYLVLAKLSERDDRAMRMTQLAASTNSTLPRLSHVVSRLERRGFVERSSCDTDRRVTIARLTDAGWDKVVASAPGHVENVRATVFDQLTAEQVVQLDQICSRLLAKLDPDNRLEVQR